MIIKLDRDYEVKCTLGTIKEIEDRFGKPFLTIVAGLDKLTTSEQIRLLYIGVHRADPGLEESAFISACDDNLGLGTLTDYIEEYIMQLQYPGFTKEEVQQKIEKKLENSRRLQAVSTGMK